MPAFRADDRCVVTAVAASTEERAERVARRLGIPHAYGGWRGLVASGDVDIVSIAVPPEIQPSVALAAAELGKPVLCEKPVAVDAAAAERVLVAAERARIVTAVDLGFAELPAWREVRSRLDAGAVGRATKCAISWQVRTRPRPGTSWKEQPGAGGGALGGFVSHLLYLTEWCLGPIARVTGRLGADAGRTRVDLDLETAGGCECSIRVVTDAATPTGLRATFTGDRGTLALTGGVSDYVRGHVLSVTARGWPPETVLCEDPPSPDGDPRVGVVAPIVRRFMDAVRGGSPMRPDLSDGVRLQRLLDAVLDAARATAWVTV